MHDVMKEIGTRSRLRALTEELAALTGASEIEAVQSALEDRLARVKGPASQEERIGKALAILRSSSRLHREATRQEQPESTDSAGAVTVDASALLTILRHGEGWEELVRQVIVRGNARVPATALAEAGIALAAGGDFVDVLGLSEIIDTLSLTVVPFTGADWRTALMEYRHRRDPNTQEAPGVGYCLTAAVAARTGTRVLSGAPPAVVR
jgi:uncharacterized protein with PIN domain